MASQKYVRPAFHQPHPPSSPPLTHLRTRPRAHHPPTRSPLPPSTTIPALRPTAPPPQAKATARPHHTTATHRPRRPPTPSTTARPRTPMHKDPVPMARRLASILRGHTVRRRPACIISRGRRREGIMGIGEEEEGEVGFSRGYWPRWRVVAVWIACSRRRMQ